MITTWSQRDPSDHNVILEWSLTLS